MTTTAPAPTAPSTTERPIQKLAGLATVDMGGWTMGPRCHLADKTAELAARTWDHFSVRRLAPTIGAELDGLDLSDLSDEAFAELHEALLAYKVVVIRDCGLDADGQIALSRRFGDLEVHPFLLGDRERPEVVRLVKDAETGGYENTWHSDVTWREKPARISILRSLETPEVGGDTLFADMHAAWGGLPDEIKDDIADLRAVHDFSLSFGQALRGEELEESRRKYPAVEHPVVRTHDETGEEILYVNAIFTSHLVGREDAEGEALLGRLKEQAWQPEYQCRVVWEDDTIVLWDNRATQHYANSDYWPQVRVMERTTVQGDRPV